MKWKVPKISLFAISLFLLPFLIAFDYSVGKQKRALKDIKSMISLETFDEEQLLIAKKWKLEKISERKMGEFSKISYQIECKEPLLLEEIKALLDHPEFFSNLTIDKSFFCFYEKISLDRSEIANPHFSSFKASWCCYIPPSS